VNLILWLILREFKESISTPDVQIEALAKNLKSSFTELIKISPNLNEEHAGMLSNIDKPSRLADRATSLLSVSNSEKQEVLEELDIRKRVENAINLLQKEIQRIKLGEEIQSEVQDEISKTQREYYLREQMKTIQKELGEDSQTVELDELKKKIEDVKMSDEANKVANKELDRLGRISPQSPEYSVARTYLEWLTELPWSKSSKDNLNVKEAQKRLDEDHYGLPNVKERVLEYLAVRSLKNKK
jgi:ATP-dependent Lon protease, bacterial type